MKKKALAVLLTASVIAGTMGGTATIVHADEEGKVINSIKEIEFKDDIDIVLKDGSIECVVEKIINKEV